MIFNYGDVPGRLEAIVLLCFFFFPFCGLATLGLDLQSEAMVQS